MSRHEYGFVWEQREESQMIACNQSTEKHEQSQGTRRREEGPCMVVVIDVTAVIVIVGDESDCHCHYQLLRWAHWRLGFSQSAGQDRQQKIWGRQHERKGVGKSQS